MSDKGTYVLILHLKMDAKLQIGKLGGFDFKKGYYAYVGSAFGPGGLAARLKHHRSPSASPHWHIDYLRRTAPVIETWVYSSRTRYEHEWAENLCNVKTSLCPVRGFGSSDCNCNAHLFYFKRKPGKPMLSKLLPGASRTIC